MIVITFILALIFLIIIAFVVKLTGNLVFGLDNDAWKQAALAGAGVIAAAIVAGAAVIGGKSDITIIN